MLRIEYVPLADLKRHPRNPKDHDIGAISRSVNRFGFTAPVIIDERTGYLAAGHGRIDTLAQLKAQGKEPPANVQTQDFDGDWLVPVVRGVAFNSDAEIEAYLVADNRLTILGGWNEPELAGLLQDLAAQDTALLEATGYDADDLDALLAELAGDTKQDKPDGGLRVFSDDDVVNAAFRYFRETGFPYRKLPLHVCMQEINALAQKDDDALLHSTIGYQVADTFHPHRFHASANGMKSPVQAFENDKDFEKALRLQVEHVGPIGSDYPGPLNIVNGTQACSNFRPALALYVYRRYCPADGVVLDTSTGYGGRLVGFMASSASRYIGIDPNTETHNANRRMADALGYSDRVTLINAPAEDVDPASLKGSCDFAFTSPPYFAKEIYSDEDTQSWKRYSTGEKWRDGFLLPMMRLQHTALKTGCYAIVNIADVTLKNRTYPLVEWTKQAAHEVGFQFVKTAQFEFGQRVGLELDDGVVQEPTLIFQKAGRDGRTP